MASKIIAAGSAIIFASLSTAAFADCTGHTAQTSTPVQTAQTTSGTQSGSTQDVRPN